MNIDVYPFCSETIGEKKSTKLQENIRMMGKLTAWVQSQEEEEQYIDSPDLSASPCHKVVEDSGRIQEEEDRGELAVQREEERIKEAEEEKKTGNSRYERGFPW